MMQFIIDTLNSPGLSALITIGAFLWLHRDIKDIKVTMDTMKKELREDHNNLAGKVDSISDKLSGVDKRLAHVEGILQERHSPAGD